MKMASNCHICQRPAFQNCLLCGLPTCREHLDERGFACSKCVPGAKRSRASRGPGDPGGVV
ncbi:MAG: hypothetical protein QCI82_03390 [Candidatus Thermoplasmatota archaeon]|nr:hypothetical protein [Candidatus Thermoplasmatota archaeon]